MKAVKDVADGGRVCILDIEMEVRCFSATTASEMLIEAEADGKVYRA